MMEIMSLFKTCLQKIKNHSCSKLPKVGHVNWLSFITNILAQVLVSRYDLFISLTNTAGEETGPALHEHESIFKEIQYVKFTAQDVVLTAGVLNGKCERFQKVSIKTAEL